MRPALADSFYVTEVTTLDEARFELHAACRDGRPFHLIIVGVHFGDSSLFDLLNFVLSDENLRSIPVLPIKTLSLTSLGDELVSTAVRALGGMFPLLNLSGDSVESFEHNLVAAIHSCIAAYGSD